MNKYLKISNTASSVSRISLEKLGLSTKRNNTDTIGQFGSGIKYAPIAALRNGWEWAFVGYDSLGDYVMKYVMINEDGIDCIQYDYRDYCKSSSFTIDAGTLSWTEPFQIYREAVSNAMDGAKENNGTWSVSIVDSIYHELDTFSVYITAAPEIVSVYNNHDLYFSNSRKALCEQSSGRFILPKVDKKLRVYCHDVLVYTSEFDSIFDYKFDQIELNEERSIKTDYSLHHAIEASICSTRSKKVIENVINAATSGKDYYEFMAASSFNYINGFSFDPYWLECFAKTYGDNAVILDKTSGQLNIDTSLRLNGLKGVLVKDDAAYKLLEAAGIPCVWDKLTESVKYDIEDDISRYHNLNHAIAVARLAESGLETYIPSIGVFKSTESDVIGLTINMKEHKQYRRILISKDHAEKGSISAIIGTLLHEYDHAVSGVGDSYDNQGRVFRDLADRRIGRIIEESYSVNPFNIVNSVVGISVKDISAIGLPLKYSYEYSFLLNAYVVTTSKCTFIARVNRHLNRSDIQTNISLHMDHDGETFIFNSFNDVKDVSIV